MKFTIDQPEHNFNSFIISNISIQFDESSERYKLVVSFNKDKNVPYTSDCSVRSYGTEKEIRDYLINELYYDKFMGDDCPLVLSQECLSAYMLEVRRYSIGFEFNEYQKEAFQLLLERGFKLNYVFYNLNASSTRVPTEYKMSYEFSDGIIRCRFQDNGEIYIYNIDSTLHSLYKAHRKYVIDYLKSGKIPIGINDKEFSKFLNNNHDIINGRIVKEIDTDEVPIYLVYRIQSSMAPRFLMTFNLNEISYAGIDLEKLLSDLLETKFKD